MISYYKVINLLYDYPQYYETAFSFRDIAAEARFLRQCIERKSSIPVRNILEVACGPAPHAEELSKAGYNYVGLDINRNMLDYAGYKWRNLRPSPLLVERDMIRFTLPEKIDFAYVMLGSLYVDSMESMSSHFDSIAACLKPGGLYFLDWCIQFSDPLENDGRNRFKIEKDGITVESKFRIKLIVSAEQMYEEIWDVHVDDHGRHHSFEMTERNRAILPKEFLRFINDRQDFEFVGWWSDWDFESPISGNETPNRPIALIRRV